MQRFQTSPCAMAPRSRFRAAQAARSSSAANASAATIAALPEPVLARCLGLLEVWERCAGRLWYNHAASSRLPAPEIARQAPLPLPPPPPPLPLQHCSVGLLQAAGGAGVQALCGSSQQPRAAA